MTPITAAEYDLPEAFIEALAATQQNFINEYDVSQYFINSL
jgi:hypothetical protein